MEWMKVIAPCIYVLKTSCLSVKFICYANAHPWHHPFPPCTFCCCCCISRICSANQALPQKKDGAKSDTGVHFYAAMRESRTGEVPCDTQLEVAFEDRRLANARKGFRGEDWPRQNGFFINITGVPPKGTCDPSALPRRNVRVPLPPGAANYKIWRMRLRVKEPGTITTITALDNEVTAVRGFNHTVKNYQQDLKLPVQLVGLRAVTITGEENYISQFYVMLSLLVVVAMMPSFTVASAAFLERYFPGGE